MAKRGGLGKGLDSMISSQYIDATKNVEKSTELSTKADNNVDKPVDKEENTPDKMLKLSQIEPNRGQPRKNFEEESMEELAESIRQFGVIQPLLVQKKGNHYEIVAGERRWRAAKLAGLKEVPVMIREYTDQEVMEIALIENIQRENLNPIEEAKAFMCLIQEFHLKQEDLAKRVSKSRAAIANRMRLLKLALTVQEMLAEGKLSEGHARALLSLESEALQMQAAEMITEQSLSVRETEKLVKRLLNPPPKKANSLDWQERDRFIYEKLEEDLRVVTGTKVVIQRKDADKGKIQMDYYSVEELERLIELFRRIK